jgi:hypothetical protein
MISKPLVVDRQFFEIYQADTWTNTKRLGDRLRFQYVFRGQPNLELGLAPTLYRWALRGGFPHGSDLFDREGWIVHEFQRRAHHYVNDPPTREERLEWLALLQHYGGPTRLLDFTRSFYVAAFFAMETAEKESAIWAVDLDALGKAAALRLGHADPPDNQRLRLEAHAQLCESWLREPPPTAAVVDVEPLRMNLRMSSQQGLFLFPTDLSQSFEENLFATFGVDASEVQKEHPVSAWDPDEPEYEMATLVKILLPRQMHGVGMHDLHTMNVNALSLFDGLDGLARSLARFLWIIDPTA